jgi:signal transduction histidine kinase
LQLIKDNLQAWKLLEGVISRAQDTILICIDRKFSKAFGLAPCYQSETKIGKTAGVQQTQFFDILGTKFQEAKKRGVRIRLLTEVTKENQDSWIKLSDFGDIRQIKNTFGNFIVTEREFLLGFANSSHNSEVLYSNEQESLVEQRYIFENLWANNSNEYHHRTISSTKSVKIEEIRILYDPTEIRNKYVDLIKSATSEISIIIATPNTLRRNYRGGIISLLRGAAQRRKVKVNLVVPDISDQIHKSSDKFTQISSMATIPNFQVKTIIPVIEQSNKIHTTFLLVDKESSFIIDINDDMQQDFLKAVGYAIYSASESRTESYNFIFNTIWKQADLHESLIQSNKKLMNAYDSLKQHAEMEKEFINITAHELRTPSQSIIGYTEMMKYYPDRFQKYLDPLLRNAERLHLLITDMVDVARIESNSLKLQKTHFDLNLKIKEVIKDLSVQKVLPSKNVSIYFNPTEKILLYADKKRISQLMINILNNSLNFTKEGSIIVESTTNPKKDELIVSVKDSGSGIDSSIISRIFSKFTSMSDSGLGLGLFISKGIVDAHSGTIEAHNNASTKGATVTFTLPLSEETTVQKIPHTVAPKIGTLRNTEPI